MAPKKGGKKGGKKKKKEPEWGEIPRELHGACFRNGPNPAAARCDLTAARSLCAHPYLAREASAGWVLLR